MKDIYGVLPGLHNGINSILLLRTQLSRCSIYTPRNLSIIYKLTRENYSAKQYTNELITANVNYSAKGCYCHYSLLTGGFIVAD